MVLSSVHNVANTKIGGITTAQLAVDCDIEQRHIADRIRRTLEWQSPTLEESIGSGETYRRLRVFPGLNLCRYQRRRIVVEYVQLLH